MTCKRSVFVRGLLFALLLAAFFANCGFAAGQSEWVIHDFVSDLTGRVPNGNVAADAAGNLYGTTRQGGAYDEGTVYELIRPIPPDTAWGKAVLVSFGQNLQSQFYPFSGVTVDAAGNLYGTTLEAGSGDGVVFELTPPASQGAPWTLTIVHNFSSGNSSDGGNPRSTPVFDHSGNLYGTVGGATDNSCAAGWDCSDVYELTPPVTAGGTWTETILHTFGPPSIDAAVGDVMLDSKGNVYGATAKGVIYRLTPPPATRSAWTYQVLYDFKSAETDELPEGSLALHANGHLYGTTLANNANAGTVFELVPPAVAGGAWTEDAVYTFTGGLDGGNPMGNVTSDPDGNLYGTASQGGVNGGGVVFKLTPPASEGTGWTESVLHNFIEFGEGIDGSQPTGGLLFGEHGVLYGVTALGGTNGRGTVFAVDK